MRFIKIHASLLNMDVNLKKRIIIINLIKSQKTCHLLTGGGINGIDGRTSLVIRS